MFFCLYFAENALQRRRQELPPGQAMFRMIVAWFKSAGQHWLFTVLTIFTESGKRKRVKTKKYWQLVYKCGNIFNVSRIAIKQFGLEGIRLRIIDERRRTGWRLKRTQKRSTKLPKSRSASLPARMLWPAPTTESGIRIDLYIWKIMIRRRFSASRLLFLL